MFASKNALLTRPSGGYVIPRSLRFRSSASAYLNRTLVAPTDNTKWTLSFWTKRGKLSTLGGLFCAYTDGNNYAELEFGANDNLLYFSRSAGADAGSLTSTPVFRDPSAWYNIHVSKNGTALTISVNNATVAMTGTAVTASDVFINSARIHLINARPTIIGFNDGLYADTYFVDGQALSPTSFAAINATTGVWAPIKYTGTYGTNGFHLDFNSYATTAALGTDTSGNGNTWTVNNLSVTAGVTYDSMIDVPTVSATGSNYCVWNAVQKAANLTLTNGNLTVAPGAAHVTVNSTFGMTSGKWYSEHTIGTSGLGGFGVTNLLAPFSAFPSGVTGLWWVYDNGTNLQIYNQTSVGTFATQISAGQVWQVCYDADNGKCYVGINNSFIDASGGSTGNPSAGTNATFASVTTTLPLFMFTEVATGSFSSNFGQRPFTYTPPTGYSALNTYNLPAPAILIGAAHMAATTYAGTGTSLTVANTVNSTSFQPDFVWMKSRSAATDHALYDSVQGATKDLVSNSTAAETTQATGLTAFGSTGFTVGALAKINTSAATYIGWQWKGGGAAVTNTNGSTTSSVSVNATSGFSVVNYTGPSASPSVYTVGHGLGVAPSLIIYKPINAASAWLVYHASLGNTGALILNTTGATSVSANYWNNTSPTSTVFTSNTSGSAGPGSIVVRAYCFAPIAGYSAFGSYTGNGSTDGPFIFTGFRPRYLLLKVTSTTGDWVVYDSSRDTYNPESLYLYPNTAAAEGGSGTPRLDFLSNGFKLRQGGQDNVSAATYVYAAFAESPFKNSLAR